ncbi:MULTISPECIES: hypothetical protein [Ralstonia]|uniref:Fe2OG dioxygenase domain-containing protein n=1 Tax=Ralstonia holmesii TaxID=3058602 RepID=A0ABC8Q571_9RALS|nr:MULTISPECIES: hypothetical protein [unclassified Ralstonia]CAJ0684861.1 hypothetical protein R11007_00393 [Ralstonia sp. LMG 32967]CAJ0774622.1 hypothetical protein LMG18096_00257 [Ralstonia sp. LMG 32967]CAJ0814736.1 hypothetical protein LMG18093_02454 [Ralstonia sp. LMG 32967]
MIAPMLDYQPDVLAPRAAVQRIRARAMSDQPLRINPRLRFGQSEQGWLLHVEDPDRRIGRTFAVSPNVWSSLRRMRPGDVAPSMDPFMHNVLVDAGVLVSAAQIDTAQVPALEAARASFARESYGVVTDALHPYEVAVVRRYLRHGVRTGAIRFGDPQVPRRYRAHNDPMLRTLQARLTPLISHVVGVPVKPSYAYLAAYTQGAVLHRHVDRPQCEYSLTIAVDYTPEPTLEASWPIRLGLPDAEVLVYQSLGDALVYAGPRVVHFREALPEGHISTSLLLHYVNLNFRGSLN